MLPVTLLFIEKLESIPTDTPFRNHAHNCSTHIFIIVVQEKHYITAIISLHNACDIYGIKVRIKNSIVTPRSLDAMEAAENGLACSTVKVYQFANFNFSRV